MSVVRRKILISALIVLGLIAGTLFLACQYLLARDSFPQGTVVAGQDVSGLSRDEAARSVVSQLAIFSNKEYRFCVHDLTYAAKAWELGADLEVTGFLDQVMEQERKRGLWEQIRNHERRDYPLKVPIVYDRDKYDQTMARMSELLERPTKICRVEWDAYGNPILVPGQDGVRIDREATFKALPRFFQGEETIVASLVTEFESVNIKPEDIQNLVELGSFTTAFNVNNVNRSSNLRIAASTLYGAVIPSDKEFSFNVAVGPREFSTGYKEAMVILQSEFKPGVGGGICQVSSTLYNAVVLANLPVVERHNHSVAVTYVVPGMDATVTYDSKDLRFRNDTGSPLCIKTAVEGGRLTVSILGKPSEPAVKVKTEREVLEVINYKEIRKQDPGLLLGRERVDHQGVKGYRVRTYKLLYNDQGKLLKRELISTDYYKPLNKLVFVGTKVDGSIELPSDKPSEVDPDPADPNSDPGLPEGDDESENQPSEEDPGVELGD